MEEALRHSEMSLAEAQQIAHVGSWEWDILINEVRYSDETYRLLGISLGTPANYESFISSVHPDDRDAVEKVIESALCQKTPDSIDFRIVRPDGTMRFVHVEGKVTYDENGSPIRLMGTNLDITERKLAEKENKMLVHNLQERVKEMTAIYRAMEIIQQQKPVLELLQEVVTILPAAWQYPEITAARIWFNGQDYQTQDYAGTQWVQSARFSTIDSREGFIEIVYNEEKPEAVEGPFLAEERKLLNSLAHILEVFLNRRISEEALRESETKFRALFEGAGAAIFVADVATGKIIDCNGKAEELIGRPREEIIWLHQTQLHPADWAEVQREQFACHARGVCTNDEALVQHRDGRVIPVIVNAAPLTVNGRDIMIGFFLDITLRKQAEEALRESEEKFRVLAESSTAMIGLYQGESIVYINSAGERLTGYMSDELLRMKFWDVVHPDDRELVRERGLARQQGEPVQSKYEVKLLTKGGETRWVELTAGRIMFRGGPAVIATFFDITERKQTEEELKEAKTLAELYLDVIGHDFSNMYQITMGHLELAQEIMELNGRLEGADREIIDTSMDTMRRGARLIENIRKTQKQVRRVQVRAHRPRRRARRSGRRIFKAAGPGYLDHLCPGTRLLCPCKFTDRGHFQQSAGQCGEVL